jgi:hypothetical protein
MEALLAEEVVSAQQLPSTIRKTLRAALQVVAIIECALTPRESLGRDPQSGNPWAGIDVKTPRVCLGDFWWGR